VAERGESWVHERWARLAKGSVRRRRMEWQDEGRLRFSIIGALLGAPPAKGALRSTLEELAAREWRANRAPASRSASASPLSIVLSKSK
jgi:hypothetical protein